MIAGTSTDHQEFVGFDHSSYRPWHQLLRATREHTRGGRWRYGLLWGGDQWYGFDRVHMDKLVLSMIRQAQAPTMPNNKDSTIM
jgi:hypothetical protein